MKFRGSVLVCVRVHFIFYPVLLNPTSPYMHYRWGLRQPPTHTTTSTPHAPLGADPPQLKPHPPPLPGDDRPREAAAAVDRLGAGGVLPPRPGVSLKCLATSEQGWRRAFVPGVCAASEQGRGPVCWACWREHEARAAAVLLLRS